MCININNIHATFHPDPISNDRALGIFWKRSAQQKEQQQEQQDKVPIGDQFLI